MNTKTIIYISLIVLCAAIAIITLSIYYSQDFNESFSIKDELKLSDVVINAYDQNSYNNNNYNCYYDNAGAYVCDKSQNNGTRLLRSASAWIGSVELDNQGFFTQVYQAPRLLGCISFVKTTTDEGLNIPQEFNIYYRSSDDNSLPNANGYSDYGYYGAQAQQIEVKPGKKTSYKLMAEYTPYGIPLNDFTKANIIKVVVYKVPTKENNPLGEGYDYSSFSNNPTCSIAEQEDIEPIKTIKIV